MASGAATEQVLEGYINAIKVLQSLDSNGALMDAVTRPIKAYLRSRPDTIRCVVKMLTQVHCSVASGGLVGWKCACGGLGRGND
jgi:anaphase-promoting complex subunit 2